MYMYRPIAWTNLYQSVCTCIHGLYSLDTLIKFTSITHDTALIFTRHAYKIHLGHGPYERHSWYFYENLSIYTSYKKMSWWWCAPNLARRCLAPSPALRARTNLYESECTCIHMYLAYQGKHLIFTRHAYPLYNTWHSLYSLDTLIKFTSITHDTTLIFTRHAYKIHLYNTWHGSYIH
jgi:hypothetical protein